MRKIKWVFISAVFAILVISSCTIKTIPLKGNYSDKPFQMITEKSRDKVWDNIIDFFATNGISIRIIDRSSGLITSDKTALTWTYEDAKGNLENPAAWVVIPKQIDPGTNKPVNLSTIAGDWNIRIKETEDKKTLINVNLVNIQGQSAVYSLLSTVPTIVQVSGGKSTGVFEKLITDIIK